MKILCIALLLSAPLWASSQPGEPDQKIKQLKIAFLTERLDLTVEESEKFWPVYNSFEKLRKENRKAMKQVQNSIRTEAPTEKGLLSQFAQITELRKKEADNDLKLLTEVMPILGPEKTRILGGSEEEFRAKLLDKIQERRGERGQGPSPRRR